MNTVQVSDGHQAQLKVAPNPFAKGKNRLVSSKCEALKQGMNSKVVGPSLLCGSSKIFIIVHDHAVA